MILATDGNAGGPDSSLSDIRARELRARIAAAPTAALKAKFERQFAEHMATQVPVLDDVPDLPVARRSDGNESTLSPGPVPSRSDRPAICTTALGSLFAESDAAGQGFARMLPAETEGVFIARGHASRAHLARAAGGAVDILDQPDAVLFDLPPGRTLREEINDDQRLRRRADAAHAASRIAELARALQAALPGFSHGDIRPETLWCETSGALRVLGFGREGAEGSRSDQRALAEALWEWLTGRPSAGAREIGDLRPDTTPRLRRALSRALASSQEQFPDIGAFADALSPRPRQIPILGPLLAQVAPERRPLVLGLSAAGAGIVLLLATFPLWQGAAPWAAAADRREAARLSGVVRLLAQRVGEDRVEMRRLAQEAENEKVRLMEKLESARDGDDYEQLLPRYVETSLQANRLNAVQAAYQAEASTRIDTFEIALAEANSLFAAGDVRSSLARFQELKTGYEGLRALPPKLRADAQARDAARAVALSGAWGSGTCTAPSQWAFGNGELRVSWPGQGEFRERLVGTDENAVFTVGVSPQESAGRMFSYTVSDDTLTARQLGRRVQEMRLVRC